MMETKSMQLSPSAEWAARASTEYQVFPNLTYLVAADHEVKLDIYQRKNQTTSQPAVLFMHGGFWAAGAKETSLMSLIPWFEMGWNVVNVEYRLARVALAPAAVDDCRCALQFIAAQADAYNIDLNRLVLSGESAGGHLALMTGMFPESAQESTGVTLPKAAAIINWYGITDVADVIEGPHRSDLAVQWMGNLPDKDEIAHRVSPLTWVRAGLPPIITIHGDCDPMVPYQHAVRLHEALSKVSVPNELLTIPGGKHGAFTARERTGIYIEIREFLAKHGLQ